MAAGGGSSSGGGGGLANILAGVLPGSYFGPLMATGEDGASVISDAIPKVEPPILQVEVVGAEGLVVKDWLGRVRPYVKAFVCASDSFSSGSDRLRLQSASGQLIPNTQPRLHRAGEISGWRGLGWGASTSGTTADPSPGRCGR